MKKVLIMVPCNRGTQEKLNEAFGQKCEFSFVHGDNIATEEQLPNAEVIIGEPSEEQIGKAKDVKWIQLTWAGTDKYAKMIALPEDLCITNARGAFGQIISEYIIGNIIALYRNFPQYWNSQRYHKWEPLGSNSTIYGKNVLILGTGDIGHNTAKRLKAFDAKTIGVRRSKEKETLEFFDEIYNLGELDGLLPKADIVIGCLPNTQETRGILNYKRLSLMKKDAVLINVGRGSLIKTGDLIKILKDGHLKGVALDVFEKEPLDDDSPLWDMENVIITPHIAGPSFGGNKDVERAIWDLCIYNLSLYLDGKMLKNVVNLRQGY